MRNYVALVYVYIYIYKVSRKYLGLLNVLINSYLLIELEIIKTYKLS